jgi:hypothetical protein
MTEGRRRTIRTALAFTISAAASAPLLVHTAGLPDTLPGLSTGLAVCASVTRLMALPVVNGWLPGWLKMTPAKAELPPFDPASRE